MTESDGQSQSVRTVIVAGLVNIAVATAKVVAGLLSGSAAVLAEAAHSFADTTTEVLLFVALRRGGRRADPGRPFGYGRESYIWALLAAVFTFVSGAGFSITHGLHVIASAKETGDYFVSYAVLAISFVLESVSLLRTVRQVRHRAKRWGISPTRVLRRTPNTTIKAVFLEDSAALTGLGIAAAGLGLAQLTGNPVWDGIASVAIGALLLMVAIILARNNLDLLVGRSAREPVQDEIRRELSTLPYVQSIVELLTLQLGPDDILVVAKINFADHIRAADIEDVADEARRRLTTRNPAIRYVFLNPTGTGS
ncbi:cation diffusion facilitator family transporter [Micromonospora sp. DT201]|uniref:cation diffusion facilitator family transporter n=1 Tax=Micromonospora sp. DT201 TaxID=3393442 RepID=UPI003CECCCD3